MNQGLVLVVELVELETPPGAVPAVVVPPGAVDVLTLLWVVIDELMGGGVTIVVGGVTVVLVWVAGGVTTVVLLVAGVGVSTVVSFSQPHKLATAAIPAKPAKIFVVLVIRILCLLNGVLQ